MDETGRPMDEFLKSYVDKYAGWKKSSEFPYSSKVIPVQESFSPKQWVLPQEQALSILLEARSFALTDCTCRNHYHRCDKPLDVCFLIDDLADKAVSHGKARRITLAEAEKTLRKCDEHGLVHMAYYQPGSRMYAFCSCCACCCHDLQLLLQHDRKDLVARSAYIARTDPDLCTSCGLCADRCVFGARKMQDGKAEYNPASCLGCGLCVSPCPEHAITMEQRK